MIPYLSVVLCLLTPAGPGAKAPGVGDRLEALKRTQARIQTKFHRLLNAIPEGWPQSALFTFSRAVTEAYTRRAVDLAEEHPTDPAAVEALNWVIAGGLGYSPQTDRAYRLLIRDHLTSDRIGPALRRARVYDGICKEVLGFVQAVREKSPHPAMRGVSCLQLAELRARKAALVRRFRGAGEDYARRLEGWYGKEFVADVRASDPDRLTAEVEQLYETVARDYGTVKYHYWEETDTLADVARAALFEIRNLAVGKVAPEIEGEDLDGKRFKLTDYRGKVVVIDFWGHW